MYEKVPFTLTGPQLRKLSKGQVVQLSKDQLSNPRHFMMLHPETAKKINRARISGKGCRICTSPHEIDMSGEGLKDIWTWIKDKAVPWIAENVPKAAKYVKENIIDTPYYQSHVKPILHEKVMNFAEQGPYSSLTVPAVEALSEKTGAFGIKKHRKPKMDSIACQGTTIKVSKPKAKPIPKPKAKTTRKTVKGGSFKVHI